ncbi:MAG: carbamoyl-phosphate synthase large subunit, partial [Duodenibacillus sp.]|nr:carbamoyl-phosphate synthase large subunit [Duodenibacillus sp.]
EEIIHEISEAGSERIFYVADAMRLGLTNDEIHEMTSIDPWFLAQMRELIDIEKRVEGVNLADISREDLFFLKQKGFSDKRLAKLTGCHEDDVRNRRHALNIRPVYKRVDTCAAEFETKTAYMYSTYQTEDESQPSDKKKIVVLGGGPNRIGQGIEFDYCCVHAALAMREDGYETIMVNCNPETVSTDYDTSDRLYFEPVTLEDVLEICHSEKPAGVIVQYGGQTPLKICRALEKEGVPIIGTSTDAIDCAEDRERFQKLINELGLRQPPNRTAHTEEAALKLAEEIGYPIVVRPSYVLGGRAMDIVHNSKELMRYMHEAIVVSEDSPVLLDHFLDDAVEMDVDAVSDGKEVKIGGLMQHVEAAGVHSGDSACSLPPYSLREDILQEVRRQTVVMAKALGVVGLMNVQFAVKNAVTENPLIYVLEVNPRASRTVPFVSKATGVPLAKIAARCMVGDSLEKQGVKVEVKPSYVCVKEAVFPFAKFLGVDPVLGPEMRSTGEVMGVGRTFGEALFKSQLGAGNMLPPAGATVFISVRDEDKPRAIVVAAELADAGYKLVATRGTGAALAKAGIDCKVVNKVSDGRPNVLDKIKNHEIQLVITTSNESRGEISDARAIRMAALANRVTYFTTIAGGRAAVEGIKHLEDAQVYSLQEMHAAAE